MNISYDPINPNSIAFIKLFKNSVDIDNQIGCFSFDILECLKKHGEWAIN